VNYGGSTGFGRAYRERLRGNWGIVDVQDCVAVVQQLAREGRIDPKRVAIRGGSAGGYTTLAALTFTSGVISVGASYYGVSELELLAKETHKLESRYLDQLVGPYPEAAAVYKERAPLAHTDRLNCPVIFFQGDEDQVVPPNQSELMYEALKKKGIYSEYHLYAGEGHGFRKGENIRHSLLREHAFYARAFGFGVRAEDKA
jgi:dipeptidyl aminopeptidase/acylaminoacyl peptidase